MRLTAFEKFTMTAALVIVIGLFCWAAGAGSFERTSDISETAIYLVKNDATGEPAEKELININTAVSEQLQTLSGIGPELAERIVEFREKHGSFDDINDLLEISGIGTKKLEAIADEITVD
ncbi:MAG: helix-hairpin-helix domain-containing protein [Ruminococcaceae bacterium]|nr:helix-hairpin-helix domain-containing protein [Oscillospiraceae bacterium]